MLLLYFAIVAVVLIISMPLASSKLYYGHNSEGGYDAMARMNPGQARYAKTVAWMIFILLVLLCVFRSDTTPDYNMYKSLYDMGGGEKIRRDMEQSFTFFVRLSPAFLILLLWYAVIGVGGKIIAIFRYSPNIWLSLLVYCSFSLTLHDMGQIRAGAAISLVFLAMPYIKSREWIKYYLLIVVAVFLHNSTVVFLAAYFFPHKSLNKWVWLCVLGVAFVFNLLNMNFGYISKFIPIGIVENYVESYTGRSHMMEAGFRVGYMIQLFFVVLMICNIKKLQKEYPYAVIVTFMCICSSLCYLLLSDIITLQVRMLELFGVFSIFAYAMLPMISKRHYNILTLLPILYSIISIMRGLSWLTGDVWWK